MSSDNDRFGGGFLAGSIFGGITGGLLGAWIATKVSKQISSDAGDTDDASNRLAKFRTASFLNGGDLEMEDARQGLEEKISQLNVAIDQAREQLSEVNGNATD
jgi:phage tail tape-measure protein